MYVIKRYFTPQPRVKTYRKRNRRGAPVPRDRASLTADITAERARLLLLQGQGHIHQRESRSYLRI